MSYKYKQIVSQCPISIRACARTARRIVRTFNIASTSGTPGHSAMSASPTAVSQKGRMLRGFEWRLARIGPLISLPVTADRFLARARKA